MDMEKPLDDARTAGAATASPSLNRMAFIDRGIARLASKPRRSLQAGNARLGRASTDADLVQYDSHNQVTVVLVSQFHGCVRMARIYSGSPGSQLESHLSLEGSSATKAQCDRLWSDA
jgi:hypothetical protein